MRINDMNGFNMNDTVVVKSVHKVGKIIGYSENKWKVRLDDGNVMLCEDQNLEKRQMLFG